MPYSDKAIETAYDEGYGTHDEHEHMRTASIMTEAFTQLPPGPKTISQTAPIHSA
jgi:hypothetical protein